MNQSKVPVTVLCGYLGSGKTTLMNHLLNNKENIKVALIVNDMGAINIDSKLIQENDSLSSTEETLVSLSNGCICCTLRDDLLKEVSRLAQSNLYDHILIEASGISEPIPIAQTITLGIDENDRSLSDYTYIHSIICVADAFRLQCEFESGYALEYFKDHQVDDQDIAQLLIEQIEFCDVLILNKTDLVSKDTLLKIHAILKKLQPQATIFETSKCQIDPNFLKQKRIFDFDQVIDSAGWIKELENQHHTPETEEYGITSVVFESKQPFHPERLYEWLESPHPQLIRSKGVMWLASQENVCIAYSQAASSVELRPAGIWVKFLDKEDQEYLLETNKELKKSWDAEVGDCINQIVLIGFKLDIQQITESLKTCLLSNEEMKLDWKSFNDPFLEVGLQLN